MTETKKQTPHTFTDGDGRKWEIRLTAGSLDKVRELADVDLIPKDGTAHAITTLTFECRKLGAVLWALCSRQADGLGIDKNSFDSAMDARTLGDGWEALVNAVVEFAGALNPAFGEAVRTSIEGELEIIGAGLKQIANGLNSPEFKAHLDKAAEQIGEKAKADLLESLASIGKGD